MKELQERLQQSEGKVREFEQNMEHKPHVKAPTTKEFIGAKANEAKEFISFDIVLCRQRVFQSMNKVP